MRAIDADELKHCISQEMDAIEKSVDDVIAVAATKVIVKCFFGIIDGTFFRLLDSVFSWSDVHELSSLHGEVISIRSYSYGE